MSIPDIINGSFESLGSLFILFSILKLYKEKVVRGISYVHVGFFSLWGFWNIYYYPYLGQWVSFFGGILIVLTNTVYLGMLVYYAHKEE